MENVKISNIFVAIIYLFIIIPPSKSVTEPSVIIIGAGPSGIAAASKLLENSINNIIILEAENRIGGRINSIKFGETFIDLGAEWCHGEKNNIVYDLVKNLNILKSTNWHQNLLLSSKKSVEPKFQKQLVEIINFVSQADGTINRKEFDGQNLGTYCTEVYNSAIHETFQNDSESLKLAKLAFPLLQHMVLSGEGAFSWFEPSARSDYISCEGDLTLNWAGKGFKTVLDVLMKAIPKSDKKLPIDQKLIFNKEVAKIYWKGNNLGKSIAVRCLDGSVYNANHVIFTPSIGVLKKQHEEMFQPELPKSKIEAIKNIGFGGVLKIAMFYREPWWSQENFGDVQFIWDKTDDALILKEFPEGPINQNGKSWVTYLYHINSLDYNPNVLMGWITGDLVPQVELISNETLSNGVTFIMNKFLGHKYNITKPDEIIKSTWFTNSHFRGTYSYQTLEARKGEESAEVQLSKPLLSEEGRPIVHFAGEAAHSHYYSTVHGAIETGFREANMIIDLYK